MAETYAALFWGIFGYGDIYKDAQDTDKITDVDVGKDINCRPDIKYVNILMKLFPNLK